MESNPYESPQARTKHKNWFVRWVERWPPKALGWLMVFNSGIFSLNAWLQWSAGNTRMATFSCAIAIFTLAVGIFRVLRPMRYGKNF